jgi:hypothetical protein
MKKTLLDDGDDHDECTGCGFLRAVCAAMRPDRKCCPDCSHKPAQCKDGMHSFSWREAGQPCRYCGEPPLAKNAPGNVVPLVQLPLTMLHHTKNRGPEAVAFFREESAKVDKLSARLLQAHRLSRVSAGLLVTTEELERLLLGLAAYQENLESGIQQITSEDR